VGQGIPLFRDIKKSIKLSLIETKTFGIGVTALHYAKIIIDFTENK
jgi:hypothetical protein